MRYYFILLVMLVLGAAALALPISFIGLDPMPGDFTITEGNLHLAVPVTYSLCASLTLGLFYYFLKR
jgi:hypothetical protein